MPSPFDGLSLLSFRRYPGGYNLSLENCWLFLSARRLIGTNDPASALVQDVNVESQPQINQPITNCTKEMSSFVQAEQKQELDGSQLRLCRAPPLYFCTAEKRCARMMTFVPAVPSNDCFRTTPPFSPCREPPRAPSRPPDPPPPSQLNIPRLCGRHRLRERRRLFSPPRLRLHASRIRRHTFLRRPLSSLLAGVRARGQRHIPVAFLLPSLHSLFNFRHRAFRGFSLGPWRVSRALTPGLERGRTGAQSGDRRDFRRGFEERARGSQLFRNR